METSVKGLGEIILQSGARVLVRVECERDLSMVAFRMTLDGVEVATWRFFV